MVAGIGYYVYRQNQQIDKPDTSHEALDESILIALKNAPPPEIQSPKATRNNVAPMVKHSQSNILIPS